MLRASTEIGGARQWAEHEFGKAKLGDRRLKERLKKIAASFAEQPSVGIPKACEGWSETKAAYRFFAHPDLKSGALIEPHQERTRERCSQQRLVLVVQDTTGLSYGPRSGMGLVGSGPDGVKGLWLHTSMAFSEQGRALGIVRVEHWQRDPAGFGKAARREERSTADKESQRWLNSFQDCVNRAQDCCTTGYVNVADREADIYDLFAVAASHREVGVLVRARRNRLTDEGTHLEQELKATPVAGKVQITVPRKPGAAARTAELEIRYLALKIRPPKRCNGEPLVLWVVEAREVGNRAERIRWRLLTNLPVENLEAAVEKIRWYRVRWQIEEYHRVLKSGCRVEARQLETAQRLINALMVDVIVAWRVLELSRAARLSDAQTIEEHFSAEEIQIIRLYRSKSGSKEPPELSLREAVRSVAKMGGFLGRKSDGEPGAMTLWRGLETLAKMVLGWQLARTYG